MAEINKRTIPLLALLMIVDGRLVWIAWVPLGLDKNA